jgi:hypothetical protein
MLLDSIFDILIAFLPVIMTFIFIIVLLDLIKYLKRGIILRKPRKNLKPVRLRVHGKSTESIRISDLTASSDYSLSKPEILGSEYELDVKDDISFDWGESNDSLVKSDSLLNCPECDAEIIDFDAFFCYSCGFQIKKPKVEWINE